MYQQSFILMLSTNPRSKEKTTIASSFKVALSYNISQGGNFFDYGKFINFKDTQVDTGTI